MKKTSLLIVACLVAFSLHAAYLTDVPVTVTQPDGSVLHCFASGDEFFNYLHDKDGYTIMQHPVTGFYVYADKRDGKLVPTDFIAGKYDPANKNLTPHNLISAEEWRQRRKAWDAPDPRPKNRDGQPNHGTLNNIAIFIRFSDDGDFENTYSSIDNMFNDMSGTSVSMRSYFQAASYGAIDIPTTFYPGHTGETIISYQDIYPKNYFQPYNASTNTNGYQDDNEKKAREFSLLERAVNHINQYYPIPTTLNIDYDNDNYVDNVCFIVKGNVDSWNSLLWPHKWTLHDRNVYINGKRVYVFNFQLADATNYFNTSTMCHEMNHSLGAPDLYHYNESWTGLKPVGSWDLMESNTTPPQHCGAYMKMKYGHWIDEIPEITQAGTYTLNPISSPTPDNIAYKISTEDPYQFYVLEYRNKTAETGIPGSGLLIYRIDTHFEGNQDYNPSEGIYDEIYIFRPNGTTTANGTIKNAYFNASVGRTEFSPSTNPQPFFTNGTIDNNIRIYDISSAGSTISFKYGTTASCTPPTNLAVTVNGKNATLTWDAAANAQSYNIYRDGTLIANTTGTTYCDSDLPYGVFRYSLKSKDNENLLSAFTEEVSAPIEPIPSSLTVTKEGDDAILTWTEPEWNYPSTPLSTLTYGDQIFQDRAGYNDGTTQMYWGHRYPSDDIGMYDGKSLYSVSFYAYDAGTYAICVYEGSVPDTSGGTTLDLPERQMIEQSVTVTGEGWFVFLLNNPHTVDGSKDLWVFIYDTDAHNFPATFCSYLGENGNYYSTDPTSWIALWNNYAFMIKTHLTDGTYTYNLYDGTTKLNSDVISGTTYTHENPTEGATHQYTLKTNFNGTETAASNMAGITLGAASLGSLELNTNDMMTVTSGSTLTVTGTLNSPNPANLIIEDGAQLIHPTHPVNATLKKNIEGFGSNNTIKTGWHTIASPAANVSVSDVTTGTYDLFTYDESTHYWLNQKNTENHIEQFAEGQGFLYANANDQSFAFAGNMKATNARVTIPLDYTTSSGNLKGFNLVGNPFTRNLSTGDITLGGTALTTYYVVEGGSRLEAHNIAETPIKPGQGFMVQANAQNQNLVFNPSSSKDQSATTPAYISIKAGNDSFTDRAYVQFGEGNMLQKTNINDNTVGLSIRYNDNDYAAVTIKASKGEMPVHFKVAENGIYTLTVSTPLTSHLSPLTYLHLIDHLTGTDIDLLQMPSYDFEAKTTDDALRFSLIFEITIN